MSDPGRRSPNCRLLASGAGALLQILIEPREHPPDDVAPVPGLADVVALVRVDHEPRGNALGAQRVPEFKRLRRGTLAVAVADQDERGRFHLLDEVNGRA